MTIEQERDKLQRANWANWLAVIAGLVLANLALWMLNGLKDRVCELEKRVGYRFEPTSWSQGICPK